MRRDYSSGTVANFQHKEAIKGPNAQRDGGPDPDLTLT